MTTQTIILLEFMAIGAIYLQRQGRWKLFREAAGGQLVINSKG